MGKSSRDPLVGRIFEMVGVLFVVISARQLKNCPTPDKRVTATDIDRVAPALGILVVPTPLK